MPLGYDANVGESGGSIVFVRHLSHFFPPFFYFMKDKKDHMLGQTRGAVHLLILPTHSLT
jgi:hypothetical protein